MGIAPGQLEGASRAAEGSRSSRSGGANPAPRRRVPELRIPYPLLEYAYDLPGDYAKPLLRLLQRAQWIPTEVDGISLDAGEVLSSLRSRDLWGAVRLDRSVNENGRVSLLRRVLSRLEQDGLIETRAAHPTDTRSGTRADTRRDTPATIVRFLKFRNHLWPANVDAAHESTRIPTRGSTQRIDAIPSGDPAVRSDPEAGSGSGSPAVAPVANLGAVRARRPRGAPVPPSSLPRWDAVLALLRSRMRSDLFERWILPLRATDVGDDIVLDAPDLFHRNFVDDNYRATLEAIASETLGLPGPGSCGVRLAAPTLACAPPPLLRLARSGPVRARDLDAAGIPRAYLRRLCDRDLLERVDRGLYRLPEASVTEFHSLAEVAERVPHATIAVLACQAAVPGLESCRGDSDSHRPQLRCRLLPAPSRPEAIPLRVRAARGLPGGQ